MGGKRAQLLLKIFLFLGIRSHGLDISSPADIFITFPNQNNFRLIGELRAISSLIVVALTQTN